jgi:hypothetical protein
MICIMHPKLGDTARQLANQLCEPLESRISLYHKIILNFVSGPVFGVTSRESYYEGEKFFCVVQYVMLPLVPSFCCWRDDLIRDIDNGTNMIYTRQGLRSLFIFILSLEISSTNFVNSSPISFEKEKIKMQLSKLMTLSLTIAFPILVQSQGLKVPVPWWVSDLTISNIRHGTGGT